MLQTVRAIVRQGKIEIVELVDLPEGAAVLVAVLAGDEREFWQEASPGALDAFWGNAEDDI